MLYPVYKSTYERGDGMESDVAEHDQRLGGITSSCG